MRTSKAANATYMRDYRAKQKDPDGSDRQLLREVWEAGLKRFLIIQVAFDGYRFTADYPGAVAVAMATLQQVPDDPLAAWMYRFLFVAFLGDSKTAKRHPDPRLRPSDGDHTVEEARELAKLIGKQGTDKKKDKSQSLAWTKSQLDRYFEERKDEQ